MTTPFEVPRAFDTIALDGIILRGLVRPLDDAERVQKIEQVQAPGYLGAFTISRLEEQVTLAYEIEVWTVEDYNWLLSFLQVLRQGMKLRPPKGPRIYELRDLTIEHCEVKRVGVSRLTRIKHLGKGKHRTVIGFAEWKKKIPIGGPPTARPKTGVEKMVEDANDTVKGLDKELAAARKGK